MKLIVIAYSHNELELMPAFVAHYQRLGADIHIYDNHSTDGSDQLARELGCQVTTHGSADAFDALEHNQVRDQAWKAYRGSHDIAIIVDMDEFLFPVLPFSVDQPAVVRANGFNCITESFPDANPLESNPELWEGVWSRGYSKPCIINLHKLKTIKYVSGGHRVELSKPRYERTDPLPGAPILLHYRYAGGLERIIHRFHERRKRIERGGDYSRGESLKFQRGVDMYLDVMKEQRAESIRIPLPAECLASLGPDQLDWPATKKPFWKR